MFSSVIDLVSPPALHYNRRRFMVFTTQLFNVATFIYIGAWMPFETFTNHELTLVPWRLVVIGLLVLLLRRLPIILALYKCVLPLPLRRRTERRAAGGSRISRQCARRYSRATSDLWASVRLRG